MLARAPPDFARADVVLGFDRDGAADDFARAGEAPLDFALRDDEDFDRDAAAPLDLARAGRDDEADDFFGWGTVLLPFVADVRRPYSTASQTVRKFGRTRTFTDT